MTTKMKNTINGQPLNCKLAIVQTKNSVYFLDFVEETYRVLDGGPKPLVSMSDIKIGNSLVLIDEEKGGCITTSPIQDFLAM